MADMGHCNADQWPTDRKLFLPGPLQNVFVTPFLRDKMRADPVLCLLLLHLLNQGLFDILISIMREMESVANLRRYRVTKN